jgi:hypothetical protein
MNRIDHLERELTIWFAETAMTRVPDYTDDLIRQTADVRQRPSWSFPERWLPMSVMTLARRSLAPVPWRTVGALLVLALLIATAFAFYIGSRSKAPPPFGIADNGLVAYSVNGDIMTVDPATGIRTTLVTGPTTDAFPVFSPDGRRVASERDALGRTNLAVADLAGGEPRVLTKTPVDGI